MKNKYQEALDYLKSGNLFGELSNDSLEDIEELVDKETPMKPRNISLLTNPPQHRTWCNNCYGVHLERAFKFCPSCGQKIDWNVDLMDNLIEKVEKWFIERGLDKVDPTKQMLKLYEEMGEVSAGLARNDLDEIKDGIGDVLVVLIGLSLQLGISVEECLNVAYNEIKDRKGKLIDGVFVKEEDLLD